MTHQDFRQWTDTKKRFKKSCGSIAAPKKELLQNHVIQSSLVVKNIDSPYTTSSYQPHRTPRSLDNTDGEDQQSTKKIRTLETPILEKKVCHWTFGRR